MSFFGDTPRDIRAMVALVFSIIGAAVLTVFAVWLVWIFWKGGWAADTAEQRIGALAWALLGILATVSIVLVSLGLVINRRTVKANIGAASFEASGGEGDPVAQIRTETTVTATPPAEPST